MNRQNFTQHNLQCTDGVAGFEGFMAILDTDPNPLHVVHVFQDGPYVVTHSEGDIFGFKVFFDIYRFEDGLIVEHWDNLTEMTAPNQSGHTRVGGPSEPPDLDETETSKSVVRDFSDGVVVNADWESLATYLDGDVLVQHNAAGQDGVSALRAMMQARADAGREFMVAKIQQVIGQGGFVLMFPVMGPHGVPAWGS